MFRQRALPLQGQRPARTWLALLMRIFECCNGGLFPQQNMHTHPFRKPEACTPYQSFADRERGHSAVKPLKMSGLQS